MSYADNSVNADYGPTSTTGYYAIPNPPVGGYTIVYMRASGGPSVHVAANATQGMFFLSSFGATGSTITQMFNWCTGQTSYHCYAG